MENIFREIRRELKKHTNPEYKKGATRFFKEKINPLGVRTPTVRKIANKYYQFIKAEEKTAIFALCNKLLKKRTFEETIIAFAWLRRQTNRLTEKDFTIFEQWLKKYVNNWAFCDEFCTHAFGNFLLKYPKFLPKIKLWTKSKNRWKRRASAVILIPLAKPIRQNSGQAKQYLDNIFTTAEILLLDTDDLVLKGYGWMLKVASNYFPKEVFEFVMKHKKIMPRTALRYAIEKYPKEIKREAMK